MINRHGQIGSLNIGAEADVIILKIVDANGTKIGDTAEDSNGNIRTLKKRIIPIAVFRAGILHILED